MYDVILLCERNYNRRKQAEEVQAAELRKAAVLEKQRRAELRRRKQRAMLKAAYLGTAMGVGGGATMAGAGLAMGSLNELVVGLTVALTSIIGLWMVEGMAEC